MADRQYQEQGERLKKIRKTLGMNQVELAEALHITQAHLSSLEGGKYALTIDLMIQLKKIAPEMSLDWLVCGEEDIGLAYNVAMETDQEYKRIQKIERFLKEHFPDFK
jgi:transcriptional regulator with XRE-family HTH domain